MEKKQQHSFTLFVFPMKTSKLAAAQYPDTGPGLFGLMRVSLCLMKKKNVYIIVKHRQHGPKLVYASERGCSVFPTEV